MAYRIGGRVLAVLAVASTAFLYGTEGYAGITKVDCSRGESVQSVVDKAKPGDGVEVSGACVENVVISKDDIRLFTTTGATISAAVAGQNTLTITGRGVSVDGFASIDDGGRDGIRVVDGGTATITNNVIQDNAFNGVSVGNNAFARIANNMLSNNGTAPAEVPGDIGIVVRAGGAADIFDNEIAGNVRFGIFVGDNGAARIGGNTISDNGIDGILMRRVSFVLFPQAEPNTIERNSRFGVSCRAFGALQVRATQNFGEGADANVSGDASIQPQDFGGCNVSTQLGAVFP